MTPGILLRPEDSPLLAALLRALPKIRAKLGDPAAWDGLRVREPELDAAYLRVNCREELVTRERRLSVAAHLFEQPGYAGRLHDHRWPIAVLPLDLEGRVDAPLYEMPWELRLDGGPAERGSVLVRSGRPWSIERCREVRHAVRSLRPHASIVVADLTQPPARAERTEAEPLDPIAVEAVVRRVGGLSFEIPAGI